MSEQAEQLVLDYLRQVGDAAYLSLRADERLDFLRRLRGRIDEMRASAGATEPEQVRKVLKRFGDPGALVTREQQRLRYERSQDETVGQPGGPGSPNRTDAGATTAAASATSRADEPPDEGPITEPIPVVREGQSGKAGGKAAAQAGGKDQQGSRRQQGGSQPRPGPPNTPQARPRHSGPPVYEPRSPRQAGQEVPSAVSRMFDYLPPEARRSLRGGALEAAGLLLVGLGGALAPLPLWFVGALLVGLAPGWAAKDKLVGLLAPVVLVFAGAGVFAGLRLPGEVQAYPQALQSYGWTLFRIGAVIGAAYLASLLLARMRRSRSTQLPWIRTTGK